MNYLIRLLFCLTLFAGGSSKAEDTPVVAVAANFAPVLEVIVKRYTALTGQEIKISAGATGILVSQIEQGAPFQLFLSADEKSVVHLHAQGLAPDTGHIYAIGVLVLYVPQSSRLDKMQNVEDMLREISTNDSYKIALANPEVAPYGRAAQQVLNRYTTADMLQGRMVLGENVGQTAQFALTGAVEAAFLPYSLTINKEMQRAGHFELIPESWYHPINQRMVLLKNAGAAAQELYKYISSDTAIQIIRDYGYSLPAE